MKLSFAVSRERVSWPKPKIEFKSFRPFIARIYSSHSTLELVQKRLTGQYCLIIFHVLTITELCNAKIPSLAAETPPGDRDRAKDFEYLLLPVREPSRGCHVPRRDGPIMKYPQEAAYWLRP